MNYTYFLYVNHFHYTIMNNLFKNCVSVHKKFDNEHKNLSRVL